MQHRYVSVKELSDGKLFVIELLGSEVKILQKKDGTLEGRMFEGQSLEGFLTGTRATVHTQVIRSDNLARNGKYLEILDLIDQLVDQHNSHSIHKLSITKTDK